MASIVNITATFSIRGPIKLPKSVEFRYYLTKKSQNIVQFPGAIYKKFGHSFIIFKTGKIVCVGGKNINILETVCIKVARILHGISRIYNFEIKNIVGSLNLGQMIHLDSTAESIKAKDIRICYDPELMEAIYAYTKHCLVILFHTGKVIFTGVKKEDNIIIAWAEISHCLVWR